MESGSPPKKSLFSQRIKQVRQKQKKDNPFPKAAKIDVTTSAPLEEMMEDKQQSRFVDRLLQGYLKQSQIEQIERENLNSINGMSVQQIENYQKLLMKQMPPALLQRISKGKHNIAVNTLKQNNQSMREEMMEGANQINKEQNMQKQQGINNNYNIGLGALARLALNIKTNQMQIIYEELKQTNQDVQSLAAIQLMVESQNNQTQIIGSKLISIVCSLIFNKAQLQAQTVLVRIKGEYFHKTILSCDIYTNFFVPLMCQIKKTKFKSCWIQMMISLLTSFDITKQQVIKINKSSNYRQIINFFKAQLTNKDKYCDNLHIKNGQNIQIRRLLDLNKTIDEFQNYLREYKSPNCSNFLQLSINVPSLLIVRLSLQINEIKNKQKYAFYNIIELAFLQSSIQHKDKLQHKNYIFKLVYPIALQLYRVTMKLNRMSDDFIQLKGYIYDKLTQEYKSKYLLNPLPEYQQFQDQNEQGQVYQKLLVTKILSYPTYVQLLTLQAANQSEMSQIAVSNHCLANILTILNLQQYFSPKAKVQSESQKAKQIENIQSMLIFIRDGLQTKEYLRQTSHLILGTCLCIFTNYLHPLQGTELHLQLNYSNLNENILNTTLKTLCDTVCQRKMEGQLLWAMISEQTLQSLINSYNYNSFGHYGFTRLLFFLMATCPHEKTIALILSQVLTRYPFLFYYALEQEYYGNQTIYCSGSALPEMREVYDILLGGKKTNSNNILVKFLLKK